MSVRVRVSVMEGKYVYINRTARSWSGGLGIDGYILDTSFQVPCSPGNCSRQPAAFRRASSDAAFALGPGNVSSNATALR